jgi:hypothetical protein
MAPDSLDVLADSIGTEAELGGDGLSRELLSFAEQKSMPALWLLLLRRLTDTTADPREEVRTGALHTILRIFDNHGDDLSPDAWQLCLRTILLPMLSDDAQMAYELLQQCDDSAEAEEEITELRGRVTTSRLLLEGTSKLFASYLHPIARCSSFPQIWEVVTTTLSSYLDCHLHDINAAVYSTLSTTLSAVDKPEIIGEAAVQLAAAIWANHFPESGSVIKTNSNQEAFESYVRSFKIIYRLNENTIKTENIVQISQNLEKAVRQSDSPNYSSDADSMTALQASVMECLSVIRTDLKGVPSIIASLLARFIGLPFDSAKTLKHPSRLTFVALSKASMGHLQSFVVLHAENNEIFQESLLLAITQLERPIGLKYEWAIQGKSPPLWQMATTTLLNVLFHALPRIFDVGLDERALHQYWKVIVQAAQGIARANVEIAPDSAPIFDDEDFDIAAMTKLSSLIIPALGSSSIPDTTRRAYTRALFESSLIHATESGELPDLESEPVKDLNTIRFGRTYNPEPTLRGMMAYHCLGDLISLVSTHDSGLQRINLAQAASPYLILRAALPLKAYIADQPLRGKYMPQPESERQELFFVLKEMRALESESQAIPQASGIKSEGKRHLVRLFSLVVRAVGVAGSTAEPDEELIEEMKGWLDEVGEEFGL